MHRFVTLSAFALAVSTAAITGCAAEVEAEGEEATATSEDAIEQGGCSNAQIRGFQKRCGGSLAWCHAHGGETHARCSNGTHVDSVAVAPAEPQLGDSRGRRAVSPGPFQPIEPVPAVEE